ncbi:MAG: hypothetical protein VB012_00240 [Erysipelotrichaceae bacterium]|nr:hypothetical protein [Erysipelotrichaceae bacterium]
MEKKLTHQGKWLMKILFIISMLLGSLQYASVISAHCCNPTPTTYTLSYDYGTASMDEGSDGNDPALPASQTVNAGQSVTVADNINLVGNSRTNKYFLYWSTTRNNTGQDPYHQPARIYYPSDVITLDRNIVLYPIFGPGTAAYDVKIVDNYDGTDHLRSTTSTTVNTGVAVNPITVTGHTYSSVSVDYAAATKNNSTGAVSFNMPAVTVTITYNYTVNQHAVIIKDVYDGVEHTRSTTATNYNVSVNTNPLAVTGHTYSSVAVTYGSATVNNSTGAVSFTMPDAAVTITYNYTINQHSVIIKDVYDGIEHIRSTTATNYGQPVNATKAAIIDYYYVSVSVSIVGAGINYGNGNVWFNMPDTDVTITYTYNTTKKNVTIYDQYGSGTATLRSSIPYSAGALVTSTALPTSGYVYSSVNVAGKMVIPTSIGELSFSMPSNNVTITYHYRASQHDVIIKDVYDGVEHVRSAISTTYEDSVSADPLTIAGHTFSSVSVDYTDALKNDTSGAVSFTMPDTAVTITYQYSLNEYMITLRAGTGVSLGGIDLTDPRFTEITANEEYTFSYTILDNTLPTVFANIIVDSGYQNGVWNMSLPTVLDESVNGKVYLASATLIPPAILHTITFVAGNGGSLSGTTSYTYVSGQSFSGAVLSIPSPTPGTNYRFVGWSPALPDGGTSLSADLVYVALFEEIAAVQSYTVTFTAGDGGSLSGTTSYTVTAGTAFSEITLPVTNADNGYEFQNWTPALPGADTTINQNLSFTAEFAAIEEVIEPETPITPETPAQETGCWVHWVMLALTLIYGLYEGLRLNKHDDQDNQKTAQNGGNQ